MRKLCLTVCAMGMFLAIGVGPALSARIGADPGEGDFEIYVSPSMIVKSAPYDAVTIHTEVALRLVDGVSATINGADVAVGRPYADSRGNLVVKIGIDEAADLIEPPTAVITLQLVVDGAMLQATDTVQVKN